MSNAEQPYPSDQKNERRSFLDRLKVLFGMEATSIREDFEDALKDSSAQVDFSAQERTILTNVLGLHELRVQDVMVPRSDIISVGLSTSLAEVLSVFRTAGHSRLPVHGGSLDDPRGMVHIRDFVDFMASAAEGFFHPDSFPDKGIAERTTRRQAVMRLRGLGDLDLSLSLEKAGIVREVLFVPPSMPALDLLVRMQSSRTHMALVIDEYGGTDGLASIEDIVETIVGNIEDEHDLDEGSQIESIADRQWRVDGRALVDDVERVIEFSLKSLVSDDNVDTFGGLVATICGRVPPRGEKIHLSEFILVEIIDSDRRRIKRVRVQTLDSQKETSEISDANSK